MLTWYAVDRPRFGDTGSRGKKHAKTGMNAQRTRGAAPRMVWARKMLVRQRFDGWTRQSTTPLMVAPDMAVKGPVGSILDIRCFCGCRKFRTVRCCFKNEWMWTEVQAEVITWSRSYQCLRLTSKNRKLSSRYRSSIAIVRCLSLIDHRQTEHILRDTVCTFPPEYCEFGSSLTRCKEWLHAAHPKLFERYYSEGDSSLHHPKTKLLTIVLDIRGSPIEARHAQLGGSSEAREGYCKERSKGRG